jgi:hypothetical protein
VAGLVIALACFLAAALVAVPWAVYTMAAGQLKPFTAASADLCIHLMGAVTLVAVVERGPWYVMPSALGAFVGTFTTLTVTNRKRRL